LTLQPDPLWYRTKAAKPLEPSGSSYQKPFPDGELDIVDPFGIRVCCHRDIEACRTILSALGPEVAALGIPNWFSIRDRDPRNRRWYRNCDPALEKNGCRNIDDHNGRRPLHSRPPWRMGASDPAALSGRSGFCERPLVWPRSGWSFHFRRRSDEAFGIRTPGSLSATISFATLNLL